MVWVTHLQISYTAMHDKSRVNCGVSSFSSTILSALSPCGLDEPEILSAMSIGPGRTYGVGKLIKSVQVQWKRAQRGVPLYGGAATLKAGSPSRAAKAGRSVVMGARVATCTGVTVNALTEVSARARTAA